MPHKDQETRKAYKRKWYQSHKNHWVKYYDENKDRILKRVHEDYRAWKESTPLEDRSLAYRLKRYGLSPEEYRKLYELQKGLCALPSCGRLAECVDHNHETGLVRGLLCQLCNKSLGGFRERPDIMADAISYLKHWEPDEE